ncbi:hypothetical protein HYS47_02665 [Candidatus Woesearchaeota archaeon]|nr:hypothetical protein [Candidatus Woesearchaeota archaeon]
MASKEDIDELLQLNWEMMLSAAKPIQDRIMDGQLDPETAIRLLTQQQFGDGQYSPEYQRFRENSKKLFENEVYFEAGYSSSAVTGFRYRESSFIDSHFLFLLHQQLGGKKYDSPEKLRRKMERLLKGKRILELGCGPGFGLHTFQDLGAIATGIELRDTYRGKVDHVDILYGDATADLDRLCDGEQFDIVYSADFFATVNVSFKSAQRMAPALAERTVPGGLGIHLVTYFKLSPATRYLGAWIDAFTNRVDLDEWQRKYDMLPLKERLEDSWTNECPLDPQDLIRQGFVIKEHGIHNNEVVIITEKPVGT